MKLATACGGVVLMLAGCSYEHVTVESYEVAQKKCSLSGGLDYVVARGNREFRAQCRDGSSAVFTIGNS